MCSESDLRGKKNDSLVKEEPSSKGIKEREMVNPAPQAISLSQHISTDELAAVSGFSSFWHHFL